MSQNPLLRRQFRIPFNDIRARHVEPGVREILRRGQSRIDKLASDPEPRTYGNTIRPLDEITQEVSEALGPIRHLISVAETPELREAYNAVLPDITSFWSRLPLNVALWRQVKTFAETPEGRGLAGLKERHLRKTLRDFQRAGADLLPSEKERLEAIRLELATLQQKFSENVLDATAAYSLHLTSPSRTEGIPPGPLARFREAARERDLAGWVLTLDFPSYEPVMKYAHDRDLRQELHQAYVGRCRGDAFDNLPLIPRILSLRHEMSRILGHRNFPDYRLEEAMASSGEAAEEFEEDLTRKTRPYWKRDLQELESHAANLGIPSLKPWDMAYVAESLRKRRYDIDDELLRPYFPLQQVLDGLFELTRILFGLEVEESENHQVWHPDVRYYELRDAAGTWLGAFFTDWWPRKEKRQGAWMNDFLYGGPGDDGAFRPHLGFIAGNFSPPEGERPSLLTHREVQTIFHEFGHLLHHLTSRVPIPGRGGLSVAWDWVELPSQLMENWTWEEEALGLFAGHFETGEPLPSDLLQRMVAARRFMGGWHQMRQLSFGTLDLALHTELAPTLDAAGDSPPEEIPESMPNESASEVEIRRVLEFAEERLLPFSPSREFARNHILTTFSHLFSGAYAAGYYSYLWSEVLDADAFTRFQTEGILNPEVGRAYLDSILSTGDSQEPDHLFRSFLGRDPDPGALLLRNLGPPPEEE